MLEPFVSKDDQSKRVDWGVCIFEERQKAKTSLLELLGQEWISKSIPKQCGVRNASDVVIEYCHRAGNLIFGHMLAM